MCSAHCNALYAAPAAAKTNTERPFKILTATAYPVICEKWENQPPNVNECTRKEMYGIIKSHIKCIHLYKFKMGVTWWGEDIGLSPLYCRTRMWAHKNKEKHQFKLIHTR